LQHFTDSTGQLKELYEDKDGLRKEEVATLSGPNEFGEFYSRLRAIKEFYRKHPNEVIICFTIKYISSPQNYFVVCAKIFHRKMSLSA
jgi:splicing factor 3A subunit 3